MSNEPYGDASYSDKEGSDSGEKKAAKSRSSKDARSGAQRYISNACKNCRALHRRCNGQPNCSNCKKRGIVCEYGEPTKRGPKSRKGQSDGDENYRDQNLKRNGKQKRHGTSGSMHHNGAVQLYNSKNPFTADSKQDVHGGAELSEFPSELDARIPNTELGTFNAPFSSSTYDNPDKQLLEATWSDLLQTWGVPVPSIALHLPHPLANATNAMHMSSAHHSLPSSTLHLLNTSADHLQQLIMFYQPDLLAAHAYRGVLIAFGYLTQNHRTQANRIMNATQAIIGYLASLGHQNNLDATTLLALAQFFSALYFINQGKSELAARFAVAAFSTCHAFQGSSRIPVSIWQRIYVLRAALEDTDQNAWEGYSLLIVKDKADPGRDRPYDLLAHIVLVFLMISNIFKNASSFNLPADVPALHARMTELKELEVYLKGLAPNPTYDKQVSLGYFFLQSTMALVYLQYIKLQEMSLDEGLRHVHECLSDARANLTRVTNIKCCPALSLAIWLDIQIVKKLLELGKEISNTLEAWLLLHSCNAPVVEERDKYPDNYGAALHKLFTTITAAARDLAQSAKNSSPYPAQNYYNATFYQSPSPTPAAMSANNFQMPPRSLAGYTADQSYRSTPWFNEQYSKSVMSQYQQYARPNYNTNSPSSSPNTARQQQQQQQQQQQYPTNQYSTSASSFNSDQHSH